MNAKEQPSRIVVTPVYEDVEASTRLFNELASAFEGQLYIVAVDDGSVHHPVETLSIESANLHGVVIKLKRNVGHQRAIAIGLNYVAEHLTWASRVVVMDSDGEDIPLTIEALERIIEPDNVDLVVAHRKRRVETLKFRTFYAAYKLLFKLFTGREINFGNFMVLKPAALHRLVAMQELWIHIAACVLTSKLRLTTCPLDRGPRYAGHSKMNFVGLALHGFKALMVFAEDVLVRVGIACSLVATLSLLGGATAIGLKLFGFATPGWFSVALGILLLVFLQTGALTLMTLMLTGVMRSGSVATTHYTEFILKVMHADPQRI
jgi:polyisoprenyl-phosphate glycosyltransferase